VKSYGDDHTISANFTTAAVVVYKPKLVEEVAQYVNEGKVDVHRDGHRDGLA
jgi:hypothetical protein